MDSFKKNLLESTKKKLLEELRCFAGKCELMNESKERLVRCLRHVATYLDKVWDDCQIAKAAGKTASLVGGVLALVGGLATVATAGLASPLFIGGMALTAAGKATSVGTTIVESVINSSEVKTAERAVDRLQRAAQKVRETLDKWRNTKITDHLLFLVDAARRLFGNDNIIVALMEQFLGFTEAIFLKSITAGGQLVAKIGGGAVAKAVSSASAKAGGQVIFSGASVLLDVVDLGFTIKDIIGNKGCKAAKDLRKKADEIESTF